MIRGEPLTGDFEPQLVKAAERSHVSAGEARLRGSVVQRRGLPDGFGVGTPFPGRPQRLRGHRRGLAATAGGPKFLTVDDVKSTR
jgi:hypothetical protein